jgi:hypothetical protein
MISKEQAEQTSDALLATARAEQERLAEAKTRPLVRIFPALAAYPAAERQGALSDARDFADQQPVSKILLMLVSIAVAALTALVITGNFQFASPAAWSTLGLVVARQWVAQVLMRGYLRRRKQL